MNALFTLGKKTAHLVTSAVNPPFFYNYWNSNPMRMLSNVRAATNQNAVFVLTWLFLPGAVTFKPLS